ncbi:hypothetical protein OAA19_03100 [Rubripirellula sp.]|nr:hypothetical protein [Rubripirellula sp.]MDB4339078.1 hypothetical protein [Rubripirellula sp.]
MAIAILVVDEEGNVSGTFACYWEGPLMQDSDIEPFGKNVFQGLEVFWSAGALVALCRCFGCTVPVRNR